MEGARGSKRIKKPNPEKSLQMLDSFVLTTDADTANISPAVRFDVFKLIHRPTEFTSYYILLVTTVITP